jgi:energy-coupling factor transporter ATP-binding protein EcfA2
MYIRRATIRNIKGIQESHINFYPGCCTVVYGHNGAGKSSIAKSFIYLDENSHNPDMIRNFRKGNEKGEIILEIGDETGANDGACIKCTITPKESKRIWMHPNGMKLGVAESKKLIQSVLKMVCLNPVRILESSPQDQLKVFLESLPVSVKPEQLAFLPEKYVKGIDYTKHALQIIGAEKTGLIGMFYDERKEKKAIAEDKRATVRTMAASIPPAPPSGDWATIYANKTEQLEKLKGTITARVQEIKNLCRDTRILHEENFTQFKLKADKEEFEKLESLKKEANETIERIKAKLAEDISKVESDAEIVLNIERDRKEKAIAQNHIDENVALDENQTQYQKPYDDLVSEVSQASAMFDQLNRSQGVVDQIGKMKSEADAIDEEVKTRTEWISDLNKLKIDLLGALPVTGVEIVEGKLYVEGLPINEINTAAQYRIVAEMAKHSMGPLGFCVMDDAEKFDSEQKKLIIESFKAAGIQMLWAEKTEGPLTIATVSDEGTREEDRPIGAPCDIGRKEEK